MWLLDRRTDRRQTKWSLCVRYASQGTQKTRMAAFPRMFGSPAKHNYVWLQIKLTTEQMDRKTDAGQSEPYVLLCFAGKPPPQKTRAPRGTDRSPEYNEQLEKALTDLFNAPPVMYASRIYVTGLVPCLVNAVDFLLYKLHVFRAAVIDPVCTPRNSIFKCISYAKTINITPTLIHLWADLAEKPKRMCRAMITSCLPSLVNMHQSVL